MSVESQKMISPEDVLDPNIDDTIAISIQNLFKSYDEDVIAVDDLTLNIKKGEIFGLLGPNGAGKTTTINILCGLLKPTSGTVTVGGYDVTKNLSKVKELIGVCPQEAAVFKYLSGRENLELFGNLSKMPKKELKERADLLIEKMNLTKASKRKAKGYSGGMIRSLNLIVALINNPEIAFLDEPTVGQDARARRETWKFIADLKTQNKTTILTTHYIEEAEALSDRVGIMDYGKLIALGTPQELRDKYDSKNLEEVFLKITGRRILEGI
jgi:ABC-2 type transport system ATP-binding protein